MTLRQIKRFTLIHRIPRVFLLNFLLVLLLGWPLSLFADQAQYFYDELGRLVGVVDGQGND